jgi:hypothetical protein
MKKSFFHCSEVSSEHMKITDQIAKLLDAISDNFMQAINNRKWAPTVNEDMTLTTHCNQFVDGVARAMGYFSFWVPNQSSPMDADSICAFLLTSPDWTNITWDVAQDHANNGALVLACQSASPHGHVCVIRPGVAQPSGHFGHPAPRCVNVGATVFLDTDVAYAFQTEPQFYVLNSTLGAI